MTIQKYSIWHHQSNLKYAPQTMFSFNTNSTFKLTIDTLRYVSVTYSQYLTQSPTTSAMAQPARHTFIPGHVLVIICSITIQLLNVAKKFNLEQYQQSYYKIATFHFWACYFSATLSLAT